MSLPENVEISEEQLKFPKNCFIAVIGPSMCGKTEQIMKILRHSDHCFAEPPVQWFFLYNYWQPKYQILLDELGPSKITFVHGWHTDVIEKLGLSDRTEEDPVVGIIIDDLAEQLSSDRNCLNIFSGQIHHKSKKA